MKRIDHSGVDQCSDCERPAGGDQEDRKAVQACSSLIGAMIFGAALILPEDGRSDHLTCPDCNQEIVLSESGAACLYADFDAKISEAATMGIALIDLKDCQSRPLQPGVTEEDDDKSSDPIINEGSGHGTQMLDGSQRPPGESQSFFLLNHWQLLCLRDREVEIQAMTDAPIVILFEHCPH